MEFDELEERLRAATPTLSSTRKNLIWYKVSSELNNPKRRTKKMQITTSRWSLGIGLVAAVAAFAWVGPRTTHVTTLPTASHTYSIPLKGTLYRNLKASGFQINIPQIPFKPETVSSMEYPLGKQKAFLVHISSKAAGSGGDFIEIHSDSDGYDQWITPRVLRSEDGANVHYVLLKNGIKGVFYRIGGLQAIEWVHGTMYGEILTGNGFYSLSTQDLIHKTKSYLTEMQILRLANETIKEGRHK